ncbi:hypothetical protein [Streptomyces sp. NPDC002082]
MSRVRTALLAVIAAAFVFGGAPAALAAPQPAAASTDSFIWG